LIAARKMCKVAEEEILDYMRYFFHHVGCKSYRKKEK
jgi:hypothetical protein